MKHAKHLMLFVCILMLALCLMFTSCGKDKDVDTDTNSNISDTNSDTNQGNKPDDKPSVPEGHEHTYTSQVTTAPTCSKEGTTTYTCSCGNSYTEKIDKIDHVYEITVTKYPSATEKGAKTYTCEECSYTFDKEIESLLVSLPDVSKLLAPLFNDQAISLKLNDGAKVVYTKELDNYDQDTMKGEKKFLTIEVANTSFGSTGDLLEGHIEFCAYIASVELDGTVKAEEVVEPSKYDYLFSFYFYVNGDNISIELVEEENGKKNEFDKDYDANQLIAMAIDSIFHIGYENALALMNISIELKTYLPLAKGIITSAGALMVPKYLVSNIKLFATLLGDAVISEDVDENGNTVYYLDVEAFNEFLQEYTDATVSEIIDAQYGEGTTEALVEFINSVPDMKLKDVALSAIAFAENYDVNVETTYELINYVIYLSTGKTIDIESEIVNRYDNTLIEVVAELQGLNQKDFDADKFIESTKKAIADFTSKAPSYNIDQLFNLIVYRNANYIPDGASEPYSITAMLHGFIAGLEGMVSLSVTVDNADKVVGIEVNAGPASISYVDDQNGGYLVSVIVKGEEIFNGTLTLTEDGFNLLGTISAMGNTYKISATKQNERVNAVISYNGYTIVSLDLVVNAETGMVSSATMKMYTFQRETDEKTGISQIVNHKLSSTITFAENEDGSYTASVISDETRVNFDISVSKYAITVDVVSTNIKTNVVSSRAHCEMKAILEGETIKAFEYIISGTMYSEQSTDTFSMRYYISEEEIHVLMKENANEMLRLDLEAEGYYITKLDLIVNVYETDFDKELGKPVETFVNYVTVDFDYNTEEKVGALLFKLPVRGVKFTLEFDKDSLDAVLYDTRKEEVFNGNVMLQLNIKLDGNGVLSEAILDINDYTQEYDKENDKEIYEFVDYIDAKLTYEDGLITVTYENAIDETSFVAKVEYDDDTLKLTVADAREDEEYKGNVMLEFVVELDENGALKSASLDLNYYTLPEDANDNKLVFSDFVDVVLTNGAEGISFEVKNYSKESDFEFNIEYLENGAKLDWYFEKEKDVKLDASITAACDDDEFTLDVDVDKLTLPSFSMTGKNAIEKEEEFDDEDVEAVEINTKSYVSIDFTLIFELKVTE